MVSVYTSPFRNGKQPVTPPHLQPSQTPRGPNYPGGGQSFGSRLHLEFPTFAQLTPPSPCNQVLFHGVPTTLRPRSTNPTRPSTGTRRLCRPTDASTDATYNSHATTFWNAEVVSITRLNQQMRAETHAPCKIHLTIGCF